jgi:nicotinate-nucleotide pyrophosphorylase (carboxylating)
MLDKNLIIKSVKRSLEEDDVLNDLTKLALLEKGQEITEASVKTREDCTISGIPWFNEAFNQLDPNINISWNFKEGDKVSSGLDICFLKGKAQSILSAERTALNFLQFMSGISTKTNSYLDLLGNSKIKLLDTRKTVPGLRYEQKYSTKIAGIKNHRFNLADGLMLKDNHLKILGGINNVSYFRKSEDNFFYEIEVNKIIEIEPALKLKPDIIMFDNFTTDEIVEGINIVNKKCKIEVSGLKSEMELLNLSKLDIDYISMGDLTKNIKAIDFSLNLK